MFVVIKGQSSDENLSYKSLSFKFDTIKRVAINKDNGRYAIHIHTDSLNMLERNGEHFIHYESLDEATKCYDKLINDIKDLYEKK